MSNTDNNIAYLHPGNQIQNGQQSQSPGLIHPVQGSLALKEELFYHNPANKGFVSFLVPAEKNPQRSCFISEISQGREKLQSEIDCYISQGEFSKPGARTVNFLRTSVSFLDLDTYNSEIFCDVKANDIVYAIIAYCSQEGIPEPSLIVSSGRGLYLKWFYTKPIPYFALPRWKAMQKHLCGMFEEFGADRKALNASRVLRIVGTINSKNNQVCKIAWINKDQSGEPVRYDFDSLFYEIMPLTRGQVQEKQKQSAERKKIQKNALLKRLKNKKKYDPSKIRHIFNEYSLNFTRFEDLRILAKLRNWDGERGVAEGFREKMLFFACNFLSGFIPEEQLEMEMEAVGEELTPTLTKVERKKYCSNIIRERTEKIKTKKWIKFTRRKKWSTYIYRNEQIIDELEITEEEQKELKTIISQSEKNRRRRENLFEMSFGEYQQSRKIESKEKAKQAQEMRRRGMDLYQIAIDLKISVSNVHYLLKKSQG